MLASVLSWAILAADASVTGATYGRELQHLAQASAKSPMGIKSGTWVDIHTSGTACCNFLASGLANTG